MCRLLCCISELYVARQAVFEFGRNFPRVREHIVNGTRCCDCLTTRVLCDDLVTCASHVNCTEACAKHLLDFVAHRRNENVVCSQHQEGTLLNVSAHAVACEYTRE